MANYYELRSDGRFNGDYQIEADRNGNVIENTRVITNSSPVSTIEATRTGSFLRNTMMREAYSSRRIEPVSIQPITDIIADIQVSINEFRSLLYQSMLYTNGLMIENRTVEPQTNGSVDVFEFHGQPPKSSTVHKDSEVSTSEFDRSSDLIQLSQQVIFQQEEINKLKKTVEELQNGHTNGRVENHVVTERAHAPLSSYAEKKNFLEEMINESTSPLTHEEIDELKMALEATGKNGQPLRGSARIAHAYKKYQELMNRKSQSNEHISTESYTNGNSTLHAEGTIKKVVSQVVSKGQRTIGKILHHTNSSSATTERQQIPLSDEEKQKLEELKNMLDKEKTLLTDDQRKAVEKKMKTNRGKERTDRGKIKYVYPLIEVFTQQNNNSLYSNGHNGNNGHSHDHENRFARAVSRVVDVLAQDDELTPDKLKLQETRSDKYTFVEPETVVFSASETDKVKLSVESQNGQSHANAEAAPPADKIAFMDLIDALGGNTISNDELFRKYVQNDFTQEEIKKIQEAVERVQSYMEDTKDFDRKADSSKREEIEVDKPISSTLWRPKLWSSRKNSE